MKIEIIKDINSLGVFNCDTNKRLIVDRFEVMFRDVDLKPIEEKRAKRTESGDFYFGENEDGFISFSFNSNEKKTGHGGRWSSNPEAIYENLGVWTVEVSVNNTVYYVRPEKIVRLLSNEYALILIDKVNTYGGSGYSIVLRKDLERISEVCIFEQFI
jgi:hypothetical protein